MTLDATEMTLRRPTGFRHQALLYEGNAEFSAASGSFVRTGLNAGESILVAVGSAKIDALRDVLGSDADEVQFVNMEQLGLNPARIIPAWREFLAHRGGPRAGLRGVGEPIWAGRTAAEIVEAQRHEALVNVAFADAGDWTLLCPYDVSALPESVIEEARRSHPHLRRHDTDFASAASEPEMMADAHLDAPLAQPTGFCHELEFGRRHLHAVRQLVETTATDAGMGRDRAMDLVLATCEVSTNSVVHGGGTGILRVWVESGTVLCEVRDRGRIDDPLVGRELPGLEIGGRGVWMVNQLCDLVQIRVFPAGTVVRLHMAIDRRRTDRRRKTTATSQSRQSAPGSPCAAFDERRRRPPEGRRRKVWTGQGARAGF